MGLIGTYRAVLIDKSMVAGAASITARGLMEKTGGVSVGCWWFTLKLFPAAPGKLQGGEAYL